MDAGRELDKRISKWVFDQEPKDGVQLGLRHDWVYRAFGEWKPVPHYSTTTEGADLIHSIMEEKVVKGDHAGNKFFVLYEGYNMQEIVKGKVSLSNIDPLEVCLAALKAVGVEV